MPPARGVAAIAAVGLATALFVGLDRDAPAAHLTSTGLSAAERVECSHLLDRSVGYEDPSRIETGISVLRDLALYRIDPGYADDRGNTYYTASIDTSEVEAVLRRAGLAADVTIRHVPFSECQLQLATSRASHLLDHWPHGGTIDLVKGQILLRPAHPVAQPLPAPSVVASYEAAVAPIPVDWSSRDVRIYEAE